jgi:hypothetical protein
LILFIAALLLVTCGTATAADTIHVNESLFIHIGDGSLGLPDAQGTPVNWTLDATYILDSNVNMSNVTAGSFTPIGNQTNPFTGSFDGQNFTISNLNLAPAANYTGLFGYTNGSAIIANANLTYVSITPTNYANFTGSLIGYADNTVIENCHASGSAVINSYFGGLVGFLNNSTVSNSSAAIDITSGGTNYFGGSAIGGFVGQVNGQSSINNSQASGNITFITGGQSTDGVGGFAGNVSGQSSINNSQASGSVFGNNSVGGFVGLVNGQSSINNSQASGDSRCWGSNVSGFAALVDGSFIENSFAAGVVNGGGDNTGGFIAYLTNSSVVSYCFAAGAVNGNSTAGGFVANITNSTVSNCYATGLVIGTQSWTNNTGGFVGMIGNPWAGNNLDSSLIEYSYAVGNVAGVNNVGGFAGNVTNQPSGVNPIQFSFFRVDNGGGNNGFAVPASASVLKEIQTFLNAPKNQTDNTISPWDIAPAPDSSKIWYIVEGMTYPRFYWFPLGDIVYVNESLFINIGSNASGLPDARGTPVNWTLDSTYILVENVDMTNVAGFAPIGRSLPFTGSFDGQNYTISNFSNSSSTDNVGLFGYVESATITNVRLTNVAVSNTGNSTGSLIGFAENTVIENCNAAGSVGGNSLVGGLVGGMLGSTVINSQANVTVTGSSNVGGFVGVAWGGTEIVGSSAIGLVTGSSLVGGFAGNLNDTIVSDCHAEGGVIGNTNVGGFAGNSESSGIDGSSASGTVSGAGGTNSMGGFVGNLQNSTVSNNWAVGDVTGTFNASYLVGGFAGNIANSTVSDCYADGIAEGMSNVGGFAGVIQLSSVINSSEAFGNVIGTGGYPSMIGGFVGNLGNSTISGGYAGGSVTSNASHVGGFAGVAQNGSGIVDSRAEGTVTGFTSVGGFAGQIANSTIIENCTALGNVTGNNNIGGFVGVTWRSDPAWGEPQIDKSSASGSVTGIVVGGSSSYIIGGFGGSLQNTIITRCYAEGTVTGGGDSSQFVGGFAANLVNSTVSVSYATGDVTGASLIGGFAGRLIHTTVSNCYARGNVTGSGSSIYYVGGFVGILESAGSGTDTSLIENCYAVGDVLEAGNNNVGGFAGTVKDQSINPIQFSFFREGNNAEGDIFANPKSSADLMRIATFLNAPKNPDESGVTESWSISSAPNASFIWYVLEGQDYPVFFWRYVPSGNGGGGGGSGTGNATVVPPGNNSTTPPDNNSTVTPPDNNSTVPPPGNNSSGGGGGGVSSWTWYSVILMFGAAVVIFLLIFFYRRREDEENK